MAAPSASKLLNLRNAAIQHLMRCQLLHPTPAAAAASQLIQPTSTSPTLLDPKSLDPSHPQNSSTNNSLNARDLGIHSSYIPLYLKFKSYVPRGPKDDIYVDYDDDDEDDDDDDYSGSDFDDDDDDDGYDDDDVDGADEDSNARPRGRGYRD